MPIIADGQPFLTYKEASRYLLSLTPDAREKAYAEMRDIAASEKAARRDLRRMTRPDE